MSLDWLERAACRAKPTSMFFVGDGKGGKAVCANCTVVADCLAEAHRLAGELGEQPYGVWGGMTPGERSKGLRRECDVCGLPFTPRSKVTRFCGLCRAKHDQWTLYTLAKRRAS